MKPACTPCLVGIHLFSTLTVAPFRLKRAWSELIVSAMQPLAWDSLLRSRASEAGGKPWAGALAVGTIAARSSRMI